MLQSVPPLPVAPLPVAPLSLHNLYLHSNSSLLESWWLEESGGSRGWIWGGKRDAHAPCEGFSAAHPCRGVLVGKEEATVAGEGERKRQG